MLEAGYGRGIEYSKNKKVRGDKFIWLTCAIDGDQQLDGISNLKLLVDRLTPIRDAINNYFTSSEMTDQILEDREIQLAKYGGNGEYYLRHKDAFRLDNNNILNGQKMRKITVIAYLNPCLDQL